jgi:POT family proton-dependent oligopeptide transporter
LDNGQVIFEKFEKDTKLTSIMLFDGENQTKLKTELTEFGATMENPMHTKLFFEKDGEAVKIEKDKGDGANYSVSFIMEETQNKQEFKIFMWITIYTVVFGLLLIVLLKKLNKLTHGAEDNDLTAHDGTAHDGTAHEETAHEETVGFELAEKEA